MSASVRRPEHKAPPEIFYDEKEARKYTSNTRMMEVQEKMTERALELLALPEDVPHLLLDLGCGSGLSGETITEAGQMWVGCDISPAMLDVAREREVDGDVLLNDLGQGLPFRAGAFDGAISISALQWLCNADKKDHVPPKRLYKFFSSLYGCLGRGARAVFQFYPENSAQVEMITSQAMKAGFTGGLVVDYPNSTKAKKMFLVLMTGGAQPLPAALGEDGPANTVVYTKRDRMRQIRGKPPKSSRDWVKEKKDRRRRQGKEVARDSKYTGRRRAGGF
ncbi:probable 18S rRNA (guanine-N(7))-methyltransferase [Amphibalanus amphitrite]|uniref:probable 18S rRNA (guanine-N(7))-methyltransferase n=1 Tax=Amphibalanus amphitrite TaxID=1232801 RepID=UPI001C91DF25|nr:probable 18S rRNA (guanine-N(7))-methyltransferase [Amphibalanus amphitrite]XP_043223224.1 probable 18S rRNA (guanine-N(7))-methyltransferase [Amphibalanus amphitrite]XP_043223225.1 probable 18S rRNA (guanine-N(7))-methyltransferase [Amphibalanus amphitrite]XP_043223226.1 probable 18S rRNA (guanine-N(7))-methyltransferase [Amphibalanus amphitrite]XP_043223227.1 probable 18S rRNA (guanine-N(7))-methyltransferase [Amphibalanus amphitrite]